MPTSTTSAPAIPNGSRVSPSHSQAIAKANTTSDEATMPTVVALSRLRAENESTKGTNDPKTTQTSTGMPRGTTHEPHWPPRSRGCEKVSTSSCHQPLKNAQKPVANSHRPEGDGERGGAADLALADHEVQRQREGGGEGEHHTERVEAGCPGLGDGDQARQYQSDRDPEAQFHPLLEHEERDESHQQNGRVFQQQRDADRQQPERRRVPGLQDRDTDDTQHGHHEQLPRLQPERRAVGDEQHGARQHGRSEGAELGELGRRQSAIRADQQLDERPVGSEEQGGE